MSGADKVNILLVDDQPAKLLAYEAMLSDLGENLIKASSAREALEQLLKNEITIVLMDVSMPDIDGFELAGMIRQHPRYQRTAIIFVSAVHLTDLDQLRGYASGAVDYVSVPVIPDLLRAKVSVFAELYRKSSQVERLNRELERRVAERTTELQMAVEKQVELADRLREADRRKDEFLALLGHELRNPLAPIRNAIAILRLKQGEDGGDPKISWCHDVIERQAAQLSRLVDDLLDVSRITQGKVQLRHERVDLAAVIDGAIETSAPAIQAGEHELRVDRPAAPIVVHGDPSRLTQVVANLLNNAAKYQNKQGSIHVRLERQESQAVITITDRGIGLSSAMLSHVFELFAQGDRTSDRQQGGLGVGLSLVKQLVELHGGSVRALSDGPGRGSEFIIQLPCLDRDDAAAASTGEAAPAADERTQRILVVDDNVDAAESLGLLLQNVGHDVLLAHDGLSALELARSFMPTGILLDIGLPGMDGYEVCRRLRADGLAGCRIIAMTGYGQEEDRRRALEAGFDAHSVKPVPFAVLEELLRAT